MRAVFKRPGVRPEVVELTQGKTLRELQSLVEGLIEAPYIPALNDEGVTMWVNDEGKLIGLPPHFLIYNGQDMVVGNVVFTGHTDEGETVGLTPDQERLVRGFLAQHRDLT